MLHLFFLLLLILLILLKWAFPHPIESTGRSRRTPCGRRRPDRHPYELFLQLEEIEHRTTKVRRPQSNGYVERLHRTLLDEHFRVMGRKKFYESVDQMQADLDAYLIAYNTKRPHQGRNMNGRTPQNVFLAGLPSPKNTQEGKSKKAA